MLCFIVLPSVWVALYECRMYDQMLNCCVQNNMVIDNNFLCMQSYFDNRMLNKRLYILGKSICLYNYLIPSINLLINKYNERHLPIPGQFILIPNTSKYEIIWNANLMQQGDFLNVFLARHVWGIYAHHQVY
jgi:hypothetical protein